MPSTWGGGGGRTIHAETSRTSINYYEAAFRLSEHGSPVYTKSFYKGETARIAVPAAIYDNTLDEDDEDEEDDEDSKHGSAILMAGHRDLEGNLQLLAWGIITGVQKADGTWARNLEDGTGQTITADCTAVEFTLVGIEYLPYKDLPTDHGDPPEARQYGFRITSPTAAETAQRTLWEHNRPWEWDNYLKKSNGQKIYYYLLDENKEYGANFYIFNLPDAGTYSHFFNLVYGSDGYVMKVKSIGVEIDPDPGIEIVVSPSLIDGPLYPRSGAQHVPVSQTADIPNSDPPDVIKLQSLECEIYITTPPLPSGATGGWALLNASIYVQALDACESPQMGYEYQRMLKTWAIETGADLYGLDEAVYNESRGGSLLIGIGKPSAQFITSGSGLYINTGNSVNEGNQPSDD